MKHYRLTIYQLCLVFLGVMGLGRDCMAQRADLIAESLNFWGNDNFSSSQLKAQMLTKTTPWYDFMPFVQPRRFDAGLFYNDVQRLNEFYRENGFHRAVLDTSLNVDASGRVNLNVSIDEGPQSRFGWVHLTGIDSLQESDAVEELEKLTGKPFTQAQLSDRARDALVLLRNKGFAFAKTSISTALDSLDVQVQMDFDLGPKSEVSGIVVVGHKGISQKTILRGLTFKAGDVFDGEELENSRRQLYRSGVFRSVILELPDTVAAKTPVRVRVTERPFRSVSLGGGYDTELGLRSSAAWVHRNFGGGARQLRLSGTMSQQSRELVAGIRQPYFLGSRNWLNLSGFYQRRVQGQEEQDEIGAGISFERNLSQNLDLVFQLNSGLVGTQADSAFSEFRIVLRRDTRDDLFNPQKGTLASVTLRERGWWLKSAWEFWEVTGEGRWFLPLPLNSVLAIRAVSGAIFQVNNRAPVPAIERYYSGGLNSVRGWDYQELGPKTIVSDSTSVVTPFGGTSHLEGSIELRVRLISFLGFAVFLDAGQVADDFQAFSVADLQWATGAGIRILTPVGPLRFDAGYRLSEDVVLDAHEDFKSKWRFHWSLGQAF